MFILYFQDLFLFNYLPIAFENNFKHTVLKFVYFYKIVEKFTILINILNS